MDGAQLIHRMPVAGVSLAVARPAGRALLVAPADGDGTPAGRLNHAGCAYQQVSDPYLAMAELCRQPDQFSMLVLDLPAIYPEELAIIPAIKKRFDHIEIWLSHPPGRTALVEEAMRLGADGLLDDDGLHRVAHQQALAPAPAQMTSPPAPAEPLLTVEELKALLGDLPNE